MATTYTKELLADIVKNSTSLSEVVRKSNAILGKTTFHSASVNRMKKIIDKLGLDRTHFTGKYWAKGLPSNKKVPASKRLILRPTGAGREKAYRLRDALISTGRKYKCEVCGQSPEWNGKPLVLEIHHKNGICNDDRSSNLEFICGHCHSQTDNFKAKNIR